MIFGPEFDQTWFPSKTDRGSIEKLQKLLGPKITSEGKKYMLLPPILFPNGIKKEKDVFLNPALVRVSFSHCREFNTSYADIYHRC